MLSVFSNIENLHRPSPHGHIANFCTVVENEILTNPMLDLDVVDITHYKEEVRN